MAACCQRRSRVQRQVQWTGAATLEAATLFGREQLWFWRHGQFYKVSESLTGLRVVYDVALQCEFLSELLTGRQ